MTALFQKPLYHVIKASTQLAVEQVRRLDRAVFNDPGLPKILDEIAGKYTLDVATLHPEKKRGKRRDME